MEAPEPLPLEFKCSIEVENLKLERQVQTLIHLLLVNSEYLKKKNDWGKPLFVCIDMLQEYYLAQTINV